jgi:methionyl-tRNA formyltransferase
MYSRLLAHLILGEEGMTLEAIVVRSIWSPHRLRSEMRRDGPRLLRKVRQKWLLGDGLDDPPGSESLAGLAKAVNLPGLDLKAVSAQCGARFIYTKDLNAPIVEECIRGVDADAVVFSGGGLIRKHILDAVKLGVINCHAGWLPLYRGMDVVEWAVLEDRTGEPSIGLTLHFMDQGVDTGPILGRHRERIKPDDTIEAVRRRLEPAMVHLFMQGLRSLRDHAGTGTPQEPGAGKQYFVMHPRLREVTNGKLFLLTSRMR